MRRPGGRYLHHNFVAALLNDLFGIQSRAGCSCAGPYGHRLLGIDDAHSHAFEREILRGYEGIKPGWVRINFVYFLDELVADYIIEAVRFIARDGARFLGDYQFDPRRGIWRHRVGPVAPPVRLTQVSYNRITGEMAYPHQGGNADPSVLTSYLRQAEGLAAARALPVDGERPSGMGEDFEALRWFELPPSCLA